MYRRFLSLLVLLLLALGLSGVAAPARAADPYAIDIVIRPYNVNVFDSWFFGINDRGQTTGYVVTRNSEGKFVQSPVIYKDGEMRLLSSAPFTGNYFANTGLAINKRGDVAGNSQGQPTFFAAGGGTTPITTPGLEGSTIRGLNDSGTVLVNGFSPDSLEVSETFGLWTATGGFQVLSVLDPLYPFTPPPDPNDFNSGPFSFAFSQGITGLNNNNQFASGVREFSVDPGDPDDFDDDVFSERYLYAYVYNGQNAFSLLQAPSPDAEIEPIGIDQSGLVFGWAGNQLALWGLDGSIASLLPDPGVSLRRFGGFGYSSAQRNDLGQVVAITDAGGVVRYDPKALAWTDITSSIGGLGTGTFSSIQGFNNQGQFVGLVRPPTGGGVFGYVVSPRQTQIPEPSSVALLAPGLIAGGLWSRRRKNA